MSSNLIGSIIKYDPRGIIKCLNDNPDLNVERSTYEVAKEHFGYWKENMLSIILITIYLQDGVSGVKDLMKTDEKYCPEDPDDAVEYLETNTREFLESRLDRLNREYAAFMMIESRYLAWVKNLGNYYNVLLQWFKAGGSYLQRDPDLP